MKRVLCVLCLWVGGCEMLLPPDVDPQPVSSYEMKKLELQQEELERRQYELEREQDHQRWMRILNGERP